MTDLRPTLRRVRVVPVLVGLNVEHAAGVGAALLDGGLPVVEVTLRTVTATEVIREMTSVSGLTVGAGTVVTVEQVHDAAAAGASFVVSPGFSAAVVQECESIGLPVIPGTATATEVLTAMDRGLTLLKFFPAAAMGGPPALQALSGPFPSIEFVPTGGITAASMNDYLALPCVSAVGGSWMLPPDALATGRLDLVRQLATEAVARVRSAA